MKYPSQLFLVLCLLSLGSASPSLRAEDGPAAEGKKEGRPKGNPDEMMQKSLGLTDAQAEQMKSIRADTEAQMKALRADETMSMEDKKTAGKKLMDANKAKIDALLSPEQKTKFEHMRQKMKKKHLGGPDGSGEKGEKGEKRLNKGVQ
jgi:Spy/CpxP family protein refolding chaperone